MNERLWYTETASPLGTLVLTASAQGLCGVYFEGQRWFPANHRGWRRDDGPFADATAWLADYFLGGSSSFPGALDLRGTEFQTRVWRGLLGIPWGSTMTYQQVATGIGRPTAARAAGAAVGRNPISLIVPCHRVVGSQGALTGYAGGLERKEYLLRLEGRGREMAARIGQGAGAGFSS